MNLYYFDKPLQDLYPYSNKSPSLSVNGTLI